MKKLLFLLLAAVFALPAYAVNSNSANPATEPAKSAQKKPDWELLPSEVPAPKKLMKVDGTKFELEIIEAKGLRYNIFGDEKEGATFAGIGTGMQCYLSAQTLKELMPEILQGAEVSQKSCAEFKRIDAPNTVEISAGEFRQMMQKLAYSNYSSLRFGGIKEGKPALADKIRFALDFSDELFYYKALSNYDEFNYVQNYDKKSYEEIAASGELTDAQLFKFASSLLVFAKDPELRDFYKNELRGLFKKAKKGDIPCEFLASAFFTETDPKWRAEFKSAAQDALNSNGILSCIWTLARAARISNLGARLDGEALDFAISACARAEKLKGMLGDDAFINLLQADEICAELLKENPDYEKVAVRTRDIEKNCPRENYLQKTACMRLLAYRAYALHKLDEKEKSRSRSAEIEKLLGELKSLLKEDDGSVRIPFMRLGLHSEDFALFLLKNLGESLRANIRFISEDFRNKLITESALGISKKEIVRLKMCGYFSGIEACEKLQDPAEKAVAFEFVENSLKEGGGTYQLFYVLHCHASGRNTPKDIEKAKAILSEFLGGLDKKPGEEKAKVLEEMKINFGSDFNYIVSGASSTLKISLPQELKDMFFDYLKKNPNLIKDKQ